jgi:hypothetical protein
METSCPFDEGRRYRVKRDYSFLNHEFRAGEFVVFTSFGYSPKEGVTRYWFTSESDGDQNVWHVFAGNERTDWHDMFEICSG